MYNLSMPEPYRGTNPIVYQALHSFQKAPTLAEIRAKAWEISQLYGNGHAVQFEQEAIRLSPAVTPEEKATGGKSDQRAQQESATAQAAIANAMGPDGRTADDVAEDAAYDEMIARRKAAEEAEDTALTEELQAAEDARRILRESRQRKPAAAPGAPAAKPAPPAAAPAPPPAAPRREAGMAPGSNIKPRQGQTVPPDTATPSEDEGSLKKRALDILNKVFGGDIDAKSDKTEREFYDPPEKHRTYEL